MGVHGLWTLLIPAGNRISIETLSDKRLAIDASIWITQFLKANRDPDTGRVRPAAHLIGFFRRICKLLYHGIRPVFVFDGATPTIKLRELNARRKRKLQWLGASEGNGDQAAKKMARKLLVSRLRQEKEVELSRNLARGAISLSDERFKLALDTDRSCSPSQLNLADKEKCAVSMNEEGFNFLSSSRINPGTNASPFFGSTGKPKNGLALAPGFILEVDDELRPSSVMANSNSFLTSNKEPATHQSLQNLFDNNDINEGPIFLPEKYSDTGLDIQALKSLPSTMRKEVIETAKRDLRIRSRKKFMSVAEDPAAYSNAQLKSFLKTTSMNKQILHAATLSAKDAIIAPRSLMSNNVKEVESVFRSNFIDENVEEQSDEKPSTILERSSSLYESNDQLPNASKSDDKPYIFVDSSDSEQGGGFFPHVRLEDEIDHVHDQGAQIRYLNRQLDSEQPKDADFINQNSPSNQTNARPNKLQPLDNETDRSLSTAAFRKDRDLTYHLNPESCNRRSESDSETKSLTVRPFEFAVRLNDDILSRSRTTASPDSSCASKSEIDSISGSKSSSKMPAWAKHAEFSLVDREYLAKRINVVNRDTTESVESLSSAYESDIEWEDGESSPIPDVWGAKEKILNYQSSCPSDTLTMAVVDKQLSVDSVKFSDIECDDGEESSSVAKVTGVNREENPSRRPSSLLADSIRWSQVLRDESVELSQSASNSTLRASDQAASSNATNNIELKGHNSVEEESSVYKKASSSETIPLDMTLMGLRRQEGELQDEWNKLWRDSEFATEEHIDEVKELIELFGIPYVQAPAEAEAQCAYMEKSNLVDGVVTEDSDALVFGADTVYKNIFDDKMFVEVYHSAELKKLGLARNELVALAMLLGGDYTDGVRGVGIVNGMEILKAFSVSESVQNGLSEFRKWLESDEVSFMPNSSQEHFHKKHLSARMRWTIPTDFPSPNVLHAYMNPVVDHLNYSLSWTLPDVSALKHFCKIKMGWSEAETDRAIKPVIQYRSGPRQRSIDSYLMKAEDNIKFADIRSARLRAIWHSK